MAKDAIFDIDSTSSALTCITGTSNDLQISVEYLVGL